MAYNNETYTNLKNRLNDWLRVTGGDVTSLPQDLLNRGQNKIQEEEPWSQLMIDAAMSAVSGEAKTYAFPSDMVCYKLIGYDNDSDGKPDQYFYRHSQRVAEGYRVENRFDISTGQSLVAIFYQNPSYPPIVRYQKQLEDFDDTEETAQYSYFPGELLIRAAQLIHVEETGLTGVAIDAIKTSYNDLLMRYKANHQYVNNDLRMEILDNGGSLISTESTSLTGDFSGNDNYRGYDNDVDIR